MQTRAQKWSKVAFESVRAEAAKTGKDGQRKYKTSCMKMPGLIHQSGALQALVFQVARDEHGKRYVDHLARAWFQDKTKGHEDLIATAQSLDLLPYMALTRDLAEIAQWFRRFAQVELAGLGEES